MNVRLLKKRRDPPPHAVFRFVRIAAGLAILAAGLVMSLPLVPGQGILTILLGLWILSADIRLARRLLLRLRILARRARRAYRRFRAPRAEEPPDDPPR